MLYITKLRRANVIEILNMAIVNTKETPGEVGAQPVSDPEYDWVKDRVTIDALEIQFNLSRRSILRILEEDYFVIDRSKKPVTVIRLMAETSLWNYCWSSPRIYRRWWREGFEQWGKTQRSRSALELRGHSYGTIGISSDDWLCSLPRENTDSV